MNPPNSPIGVVSPQVVGRYTTTDAAVLQQLADLRVELVALRNLLEVGLDLLANDVPLKDVAQFLTSSGPFNAQLPLRDPPSESRVARVARID